MANRIHFNECNAFFSLSLNMYWFDFIGAKKKKKQKRRKNNIDFLSSAPFHLPPDLLNNTRLQTSD